MIIRSFIPELELWIHKILTNNNLTSSYVNNPVKVSEKWRCRDSVIELLFNETFSSSGKLYDRNLPFIYLYKTANIKKLFDFDPLLYRRIQIYPYKYVWCASDPDNEELKEIQNEVIPTFSDDTNTGCSYYSGINPTKYVTKYKSVIVTTSNDELHVELPDGEDPEPDPDPEVYGPDANILGLTEEELEMCQYLYYYRTGQFELIHCFPRNFYFQLRSPLSKWIYLYLQCYMFNVVNYQYLNTITTEDDGILRCMFEKHAQDRIYQYIQKQHCVIWNDIQSIGGNRLRRIFEDQTMPCLTFISRRKITEQNLNSSEVSIQVKQDNQPTEINNFEFIYDGVILRNGIDYEVINIGNFKETLAVVKLKNKEIFKVGGRYHMMWSCLTLTTPNTRIKGFDDE